MSIYSLGLLNQSLFCYPFFMMQYRLAMDLKRQSKINMIINPSDVLKVYTGFPHLLVSILVFTNFISFSNVWMQKKIKHYKFMSDIGDCEKSKDKLNKIQKYEHLIYISQVLVATLFAYPFETLGKRKVYKKFYPQNIQPKG